MAQRQARLLETPKKVAFVSVELRMPVFSVVLGMVRIVAASHAASPQRSYRWMSSPGDEQAAPRNGSADRLDRALRNFSETFPSYVAVEQWPQLYIGINLYFVVRSNSLVISMAGLMDTATGQLSSYTPSTRSMVSRYFSSAVRCSVCLILLSTRTLFSVSTSPTVSA